MLNKKISIRVVGIGFDRIIVLSKNSKVLALREFIRKREGDLFRRNGEELHLDAILKDKDIIIYARTIRGAATFSIHGKRWRIHKTDKDNFPSDFHIHNCNEREKLDLKTGIIFSTTTKQPIRRLPNKELIILLNKLSKSKEEEFNKKAKLVLLKNN